MNAAKALFVLVMGLVQCGPGMDDNDLAPGVCDLGADLELCPVCIDNEGACSPIGNVCYASSGDKTLQCECEGGAGYMVTKLNCRLR